MNLKNHESSPEHLLSSHKERKGTSQEKYDRYRAELKSTAAKYRCGDLLDIKMKFRKDSASYEDSPEVKEAMAKAKQITIQKALELLENSPSKLPKSILKAIERRRLLIFMASVGNEEGKSHGKIQQVGDWDPQTELFKDGAIVIDNEYVGNYIGAAGVIAHELRHIMDCEETRWDERKDKDGNIIRKKLDIGIEFGRSDLGLNKDIPQERANIYSGGILAVLGWNPDTIWTKMSYDQKDALREVWGPDWDGKYSTSGTCSAMDEKMKLYLKKHYNVLPKLKTQKCGRICLHKEYGICDNYRYFPPCEHHR